MGLAVITGGSRGLGAALCEEYGRRGWEVVEFSRSAPHAFSREVDLSDPAAAEAAFIRAFESLGDKPPEELVAVSNAAMLGPVGPLDELMPEGIAEHMATNVVSAMLFARAVIRAFQHWGCPKTYVNVSSGAAVRGTAGWTLYCASKAAMENFVRAVALEQRTRPHPIAAISVNPGVMDTDMQALIRGTSACDFPERERYVRLEKEGRLAPPDRVARRIADLVAARPEPGSALAAQS